MFDTEDCRITLLPCWRELVARAYQKKELVAH